MQRALNFVHAFHGLGQDEIPLRQSADVMRAEVYVNDVVCILPRGVVVEDLGLFGACRHEGERFIEV